MIYLTCQESRDIDRKAIERFGISGLVLMENAGRGAVDTMQRLEIVRPNCPIAIVCGNGNNGGDGLVIARHLKIRGMKPTVFLPAGSTKLTADAESNFNILQHCNISIQERNFLISDCDQFGVVIDAMLGTGAKGSPRDNFAEVIRSINKIRNKIGVKVIAIDIPSGLDADTGEPNDPTIYADYTLTFYASKVGFKNPIASKYLGTVLVHDIGIDFEKFAE
ncbi:MAG: NAD(P)H-hydrate epimerase [Planctomycetaceae bacterium]|jgi:NAD(P)H-hydrate epimerase|nr:NAD(P)H-hydrate epimerase [Planctomycetaceae bacterium]